MHVVIAGGGLAGLVAARRLATAGVDVELFAATDAVGHRVRSRTVEGYTIDEGWPLLYPAASAVRRELDVEALSLRRFPAGVTIAAANHRSTLDAPAAGWRTLVTTLLNPDVTVGDTVRLARRRRRFTGVHGGPFEDVTADSELAAGLEAAGYSTRFRDRVAAPLAGAVALDQSLGTSWALFRYVTGLLVEDGIALPADGMAAVASQLADRARAAGATIRTGRDVTAVAFDNGKLTVEAQNERVFPDAAVVASDPSTAATLTGVDVHPEWRGCLVAHVALPARTQLATEGRVLLNADPEGPAAVLPVSTVAPSYVPDDSQLLRVLFLDDRTPDEDAVATAVRESLAAWFPEYHVDELAVVDVARTPHAQLAHSPEFAAARPPIDAPDGPVYLAGSYTTWPTVDGALEAGRRAAVALLSDLE